MGVLNSIVLLLKLAFYIASSWLKELVHLFKPPCKKSISSEVVLVTGAGHGIGRQLSLELAKLGATVVVWDINKENNEKTAEEIKQAGGKAFAYVCDVTNSTQIASVANKMREDVGEVSILVNNAGVLNGAYLQDLDEKMIRHTFEVNTLSHFWMNKEFLPNMIKNDHGHIFNVASIAGLGGQPVLTDYSSSKFAVVGLARSLKLELAQQGYNGINVSTLCPSVVDTGMLRNFQSSIFPTLTVEEVVTVAIDGLLRNYEMIVVPSNMWYSLKVINFIPLKAQDLLLKFGLVEILPQIKKEN